MRLGRLLILNGAATSPLDLVERSHSDWMDVLEAMPAMWFLSIVLEDDPRLHVASSSAAPSEAPFLPIVSQYL